MSSKKTDILQIKQYLNGELDARAMHELEKRAQHDPFLQDALEGYEAARPSQDQPLADLQQRLQQRVAGAQRSVIPWPLLGIAASVVVVSLVGLLWYRLNHQPTGTKLAANPAAVTVPDTLAAAEPKPAVTLQAFKQAPKAQQMAGLIAKPQTSYSPRVSDVSPNATITIDEPVGNAPVTNAVTEKDTLQKVAATGYFTHRKTEILGGRATLKPDTQGRMVNQLLKSRVDGVQVETADGQHRVAGTLLDGIDGQPLAGATVKLKDLPKGTYTDKDGYFSIAANAKDVLVMSSIGYQSQEVKVGMTDSLSIGLKPDNKALAEVAVGYGTKKSVKAGPLIGWDSYNSYLTTAKSPDHQTGRVKISFTVKPDSSLDNFKILSSVSKATDKAAVTLVKKGPAWHTNTNREPEQVTLEISFH